VNLAGSGSGRVIVTIGLSALCWAGAASAAQPSRIQAVRVHMQDGRTLEARSCRIEGDVAVVDMGDDGAIGFPASRVVRLEPYEIVITPPEPALVKAPAPLPVSQPSIEVSPATPAKPTVESLIQQAALRYNVDEALLAAVVAVESGYKPRAVSSKGAQGLMQLMPATAKDLAVTDPFDAAQNIDAGARYLRQLLDQHGDSYVKTLAAYNAGMGRVAKYKGVPPYRETIKYIERVLARYAARTSPPPSTAARTIASRSTPTPSR